MSDWIDNRTPVEFFKLEVETALQHQRVRTSEDVSFYLVNLLTSKLRSEPAGGEPVGEESSFAEMLLGAMSRKLPAERLMALREVGDLALFMSGIFSDRLVRGTNDIGYYIDIGRSAYSHLSDLHSGRLYSELFNELARRFGRFVDVLSEVSEHTQIAGSPSLLSLYEFWLSTGSRRREARMLRLGLAPVRAKGRFN